MVGPATALLRLAMLLGVLGAGSVGIEVHPAAEAIAMALLPLYGAAYVAIRHGWLRPEMVGHLSLVDGALVGILVYGSGPCTSVVLLLALVAIATAHLAGGPSQVLVALLAGAAGWIGARLADLETLLRLAPLVPFLSLGNGLEIEFTYDGRYLGGEVAYLPLVQLAGAALGIICVAVGMVFLRAYRERRRAGAVFQETSALEAVVDAWTSGASETAFWQTVLRSAHSLCGSPVYAAHSDGDTIWVRGPADIVSDSLAEQNLDAVLRDLRIGTASEDNAVACCLRTGVEIETQGLTEIACGGRSRLPEDLFRSVVETAPCRVAVVPVPTPAHDTALIAVAPGRRNLSVRALYAVAGRTALILQAWEDRNLDVVGPDFAGGLTFDPGVSR